MLSPHASAAAEGRGEIGGSLAIVDLDGVLVDLHLDSAGTRRAVDELLAPHGLHLGQQGLPAAIDAVCACAEVLKAGAGAQLAKALWDVIDREEAARAPQAKPHPGALAFLDQLASLPVALYTNIRYEFACQALRSAGIDPSRFFSIEARRGPSSVKPLLERMRAILSAPAAAGVRCVFLLGTGPADMAAVQAARDALGSTAPEMVAIGYAHASDRIPALEKAGADFVVTALSEAAQLMITPRSLHSLSMVLLALDQEPSIAAMVRDCQRVGRLWLSGYEIVVIDDGSTHGTAALAEDCSGGEVRVVRHGRALDVGAALRDGYAASRCDYIAYLPADRQVRPQSLVAFLPLVSPETTVVGSYAAPPAGQGRRLMSLAFRLMARGLGGLQVDFAGAYLFHRRWLERVNLETVRSETFLFSFELLEKLRRAGSRFQRAIVHPFPRQVGQNRNAAPRRVLRVLGEILRCRVRDLTP